MNQYVSNLSYCRDDEFCTQVAAHAKSRLSDKDSFIREKAYETFGIAASAISDKDPLQEHFLFLKQALIEAKTCQDVRGIAYACARGLEGSPQGMSLNDFTGWLNRIFTRENKFTDLIEDRLTPAQKMIVDMLQIASGNSTCAMKLMPDRRFPGPTFRRTYKLPDGTLKTIEVTPRINYDDDKEIRKTAKLVKEEAFYSDENKQDGIALHQLFHNAFIFLAYVAGQLETEHKMDDAFRFKGQIIDYLERSILFNLVEYDGFGYSTNWGEKIGAMFELYESLHINGEDSNKYIDFKDKAFSGMFFEKNDESKKFFGERIPLFKMINDGIEEYAVGEAAIKTGNDIRGLFIHSGEYKDKVARTKTTQTYQDLIKESRRSVEILKAKIALGALNTARNRGMQPVRVLLYKMGNNTHFDNLMLADPVGYTKSIYRVDITKQAV
ncbi:MAG: hypothetical protein HYZ79_01840 [Candidatus Melainabacteria bacterium]|nr:hypothetical protein [Candidatus Melainabacteria bacterium]